MMDKETITRLKEREKEIINEMNFFKPTRRLEEELYEIVDTLKILRVKNEKQSRKTTNTSTI
jgi:hypothetical protein